MAFFGWYFSGENVEEDCEAFWKSSLRKVEIVAPVQLLQPGDVLFHITAVPYFIG